MTINGPTTAGQILTSAYVNNMPRGVISYVRNTTATADINDTAVHGLFSGQAFTPIAGRVYRLTYSVGYVAKTDNGGNVFIYITKDSESGTKIDGSFYSSTGLDVYFPYSKSVILTTTQMGTSSFTPFVTLQANTAGYIAGNSATEPGAIIIEDIGAA